VAGLAAGVLVAGLIVALTGPDGLPRDHLRADQVPSLFGYDATSAQRLLERRGLDVTGLPIRSCQVYGRVVGTDPPVGTPYHRGDPITVYTAVPANITCLTNYQEQATAWQLLDFANGRGAAPPFARRVFVYAGDGPAAVLSRSDAADPGGWAGTGVLAALREASARVALLSERPLEYAEASIRVTEVSADRGRCGVPPRAMADDGSAFSLQLLPPTGTGCPVRVDLYRARGRYGAPIQAVVLYTSP
jgi:hypothetical protein